jgi:hypothetical protein
MARARCARRGLSASLDPVKLFNEGRIDMARKAFLTRMTAAAAAAAALMAATVPAQAKGHRTWYVGPGGPAGSCGADTQATPFATLQAAVGCAASGDVVSVAPSAAPYPGLGWVGVSVTIQAAAGADARSVVVDESLPGDSSSSPGELLVPPSATVTVRGLTLGCVSQPCLHPVATNQGSLTLRGVTVTGGDATGVFDAGQSGGPVARLVVRDSAIVHNQSGGGSGQPNGGGVFASGVGFAHASVEIDNSTISDNSAQGRGGGVYQIGADSVSLTNDTISGNQAVFGGGLASDTSNVVSLSNTLIAGNTSTAGAPDCGGTLVDGDGGHNLIAARAGCSGVSDGQNGDVVGISDAGVEPLADNGGPTDTNALQTISPAIDQGDPATCQSSVVGSRDQRGDARRTTNRVACDIGAYDTAGSGGTIHQAWYVGPGGSDAACAGNSKTTPFATLQAAVACAAPDDVVVVAPSRTPYPGIGRVPVSLTIEAAPGATARSVIVDESRPGDGSPTPGELVVGTSAAVVVRGMTLGCVWQPCYNPIATNQGSLTLRAVMVSGGYAGGVYDAPVSGGPVARLVVRDSAIEHNALNGGTAAAFGAGVYVQGGATGASLQMANSTIGSNSAFQGGGGLYVGAADAASLTNVTIAGNEGGSSAGGILTATPGLVKLSNTLIGDNWATSTPSDCGGTLADGPGGHNLIGVSAGCSGLANGTDGDRLDVSAGTQLVGDNGGPTDTSLLIGSSPAIGHGDPATCQSAWVLSKDQRGSARRVSSRGTCDIGAYDTGGR